MGKTVRGIYENGEIRLLEDPQITGRQEVYIVFPDDEKPRVSGIPASDFQRLTASLLWGAMPWRTPRVCGRSTYVPQIIIDTSMLVPRLDARDALRQPALRLWAALEQDHEEVLVFDCKG